MLELVTSKVPTPPPLAAQVTGVINCCDEFGGHPAEYSRYRMRELHLPTMDYCSPTAQQIENGLDFIRKQPQGGTVYVHCKARLAPSLCLPPASSTRLAPAWPAL